MSGRGRKLPLTFIFRYKKLVKYLVEEIEAWVCEKLKVEPGDLPSPMFLAVSATKVETTSSSLLLSRDAKDCLNCLQAVHLYGQGSGAQP